MAARRWHHLVYIATFTPTYLYHARTTYAESATQTRYAKCTRPFFRGVKVWLARLKLHSYFPSCLWLPNHAGGRDIPILSTYCITGYDVIKLYHNEDVTQPQTHVNVAICSALIANLAGYVTGRPLRNGPTSYATGHPMSNPFY